jgi:hypothetical protein
MPIQILHMSISNTIELCHYSCKEHPLLGNQLAVDSHYLQLNRAYWDLRTRCQGSWF